MSKSRFGLLLEGTKVVYTPGGILRRVLLFTGVWAAVLCIRAHGGDVQIAWQNFDNALYDADGSELRTIPCRFQIVFDMRGNTDVGRMISDHYWAITNEAPDTADYGSDEDVTVSSQNTNWVYFPLPQDQGLLLAASQYPEGVFASTHFYVRFFDSADTGTATQAGLAYNTQSNWITAGSSLDPQQESIDLSRTLAQPDGAGSTDGIHADGWATMRNAAPPTHTARGTSIAWLTDHGFTNNFDVAETNDPDHDGSMTWEEYAAGTDPTNYSSAFRIVDVSYHDGSNEVVWYATTNSGVYTPFDVYISSNLMSGWSGTPCVTGLMRNPYGTNCWWHTNPPPDSPIFYLPSIIWTNGME